MRTPTAIIAAVFGGVRFEVDEFGGFVFTHLQKFSRCGFLITWPFCLHIWYFWKKQEYGAYGWIPGSEQGVYARTPGWRYDAELGMKWTWGYVGGRWD